MTVSLLVTGTFVTTRLSNFSANPPSRFGTYSSDLAINAGLDLEMPGPPRWRTPLLIGHLLSCQKVLESTLDERATHILSFVQRQARRNPDVVFGDGEERSRDSPEARAFCRKLAADGMVVLKNDGNVLPVKGENVKRVALIGPKVKERIISGGGSAALRPTYVVTPSEGLINNAPEGIEFKHELGCYGELWQRKCDLIKLIFEPQHTSTRPRWRRT